MKIKKLITFKKTITFEQYCCFSELTLLSKEEYFKNKDNIELIDDWWWLRSPSKYNEYVSIVFRRGDLNLAHVDLANCSVRQALILESANLCIGDKFKFYGHNWTMISKRHALCDEPFCHMAFREYWAAKNSNIYEASDIKIYLDNEWEKMKNGEHK